ncbi:unnamed protein product [Lepeophtheirus salmonis]|uniref:(salmon louse) hypothetical protein n=1 Tax=Lepeophtheirus salmonis TaxID=72036 RepID=A0A7R8CQK5_LEPSM|nr:unnamed protein product [Lepeophtheirus salmonis]CAF2894194.1 unnamed protein product [Lepeophtheirus salmonis]
MTRLTRLRLPSLESIKKHIQESPTNFRLLYKIFIDESPIKSKEGDPKRRSISFNNNSKKTPDSDVDRHIKSLLKTAAKQHHENNVKDLHCTIQLMNKTIKTYGGVRGGSWPCGGTLQDYYFTSSQAMSKSNTLVGILEKH